MRFNNLLGQSAIEYLMTYGWMLLVVAIAGGTIFSIVGGQDIESVTGFSGEDVRITDTGLTEDSLQLGLRSGSSDQIEIQKVEVKDQDTGTKASVHPKDIVPVGESAMVELQGIRGGDGSNTYDIIINYDSGGLTDLKAEGEITGSFEVFNSLTLTKANFNRSTDELQIDVKNTGNSTTDSVSYTVNANNTEYTGNLPNLSPGKTGRINVTTDETYSLQSVNIEAEGESFVNTSSGLKCTTTKGLVGYWSFNDEQTENGWAIDLSGQGNNGSLENNPDTGETGAVGESYMYDGSSYVTTEEGLNTVNITLSGWVKYSPESTGDSSNFGNPIIQDDSDYDSALFADMERDPPIQRFYIKPEDTSNSANIGSPISKDEWHFVTGVRDGRATRLYINGEQERSTSTTSGQLSIPNWRFAQPASGAYLQGKIDDVRVHNRSLSQSEIQRLYEVRSKDWAVSGCKLSD